jgi:hypothetical protein
MAGRVTMTVAMDWLFADENFATSFVLMGTGLFAMAGTLLRRKRTAPTNEGVAETRVSALAAVTRERHRAA